MSVCPVCKKHHGVTEVRVWTSSALFPVTCRACGAKFHPGSTASTVLAELVFLPFSLVAAFASPSALVAVIALLGFAVAFVAIRALVSLVPAKR
jgi:prepilin signal peptidase PulO-like enzyme (type II secretory pathway)